MKYLVQLELDESVDIDFVDEILSNHEVQLRFRNLDVFKKSFIKFSNILWDYADKIKSLHGPSDGNVFEDTVTIMSELEDKLEICINHLVLDYENGEAAKEIIDFYCDDIIFNGLRVSILAQEKGKSPFENPIDVIAFIERGNYLGVSLGLHIMSGYTEGSVYLGIKKYLGVIYGWMEGFLWSDVTREDIDIYFIDVVKGRMK